LLRESDLVLVETWRNRRVPYRDISMVSVEKGRVGVSPFLRRFLVIEAAGRRLEMREFNVFARGKSQRLDVAVQHIEEARRLRASLAP
jgi:hypothetical protein